MATVIVTGYNPSYTSTFRVKILNPSQEVIAILQDNGSVANVPPSSRIIATIISQGSRNITGFTNTVLYNDSTQSQSSGPQISYMVDEDSVRGGVNTVTINVNYSEPTTTYSLTLGIAGGEGEVGYSTSSGGVYTRGQSVYNGGYNGSTAVWAKAFPSDGSQFAYWVDANGNYVTNSNPWRLVPGAQGQSLIENAVFTWLNEYDGSQYRSITETKIFNGTNWEDITLYKYSGESWIPNGKE